jgi:hypothetical protein
MPIKLSVEDLMSKTFRTQVENLPSDPPYYMVFAVITQF